ncbi:MAG: hypothetical protein AB1411_07675 [Nitrospirota bacterium]
MQKLASWILCSVAGAVWLALAGCAGSGETVDLYLQALGPIPPKGSGETILVMPFEDQRAEKQKVGMRTHVWGGVTYFDVPGGKAGDALAEVVADYLKKEGRQVSPGKGPAQAETSQKQPDVTLTGQIHELSAHAKSRFGSTEITIKVRVALRAMNAADRSTTKMTLEGARTQTVFWFEPRDVQDLLNATLNESLQRLITDVKVEGRSWRIK